MSLVEHLVSDSNINLKGGNGRTPLMAAAFKGHKSVFDLLESKGADSTLLDTFGDSLLHLACQGGNMSLVEHLVSDSNINLRNGYGRTPLMAAAFKGHKSVFDLLESKGADSTLLDTFGDSLLHLACQGGNMSLVEHLVSDSNINLKSDNGWTPLMAAAVKGHKSVFDFLESKGADSTLLDTFGDSLLHLACQGGKVALVEHLVSDSNINLRGSNGWTPIMAAALYGHKNVFDFLDSKGADSTLLDTFGDSLLHLACQGGNMSLVEHLVSDSNISTLLDTFGDSLLYLACQGGNMSLVEHLVSDSNINLKSDNGWTPLMAAALYGHKNMFDFLESKGADSTLLDTFGDSLLYLACQGGNMGADSTLLDTFGDSLLHLACQGGNMSLVEHLVSDSNINLKSDNGRTPLMAAAFKGHKSVFDLLESKGADSTLLDTFGNSLLHLACQGGKVALVEHLVSDSNINLRGSNGWTPLMAAAVKGHKSVFDLLESKGADSTLLDTFGDSLLYFACQGGNMSLVEHLVSDSNINLKSDNGWTPLMAAALYGHKNVFDLLESKGADSTLLDTFGDSLLYLACEGGNMSLVEHLVSDSNINLKSGNGWTPLMAAAVKGHKNVFDFLESKGADSTLLDTFGDSLLHLACQGGNVALVEHLVSDSNINLKGGNGRTPLMAAAFKGHKSVFDLLESKGADSTLLDTFGDSLFHLACQGGNMSLVEHLVSDSNINLKSDNGWTPIMAAAVNGHKNVFDFLESKGADSTLLDIFALMAAAFKGHNNVFDFLESKGADSTLLDTFGDSLLHLACEGGKVALVEHLVSDSNINLRGSNGWTPIMASAPYGHKNVFDFLESKGADSTLLDIFGNSLLHFASQGGNMSLVEHLVSDSFTLPCHLACQGSNMSLVEHLVSDSIINLKSGNGLTPIMAAALYGHKNVFDFLESKGADSTLLDTFGDSLLYLACQGGNMSLVEHLVSDSNINLKSGNGWTPLMAAAVNGHKNVFDFLESKGADSTLLDTFGDSLLHLACEGGKVALVEHLVSDSNINLRGSNGWTPIMASAPYGHKNVFDFLESKGADSTLLDIFGNSLLHFACQGGNMSLVEHLVSDSNINLKSNNGWTPIMAASVNGHKNVFDFLESKGADSTLLDTFGDSLLHLPREGKWLWLNIWCLILISTSEFTLPCHLACQGSNMSLVEHLVSDSIINLKSGNGLTPIMAAALYGHKNVFDFLESKGADSTLLDTFGDSLLYLACQGGNMSLVEHLVSDSNINLKSGNGWTPLMAAAVNGHKNVFDFLESKGADSTLLDTFGDSLLHLACEGGKWLWLNIWCLILIST
ncbi:serine/threonine-protein phosphatase 6 regulatory ankyrin repeat subunit B-like [Haliotis rubra]|uniref:serine/threonine-protein phosphatase 6 regulatory ankyrin repeat subunit B-like n=1 Tax=Haliotis rubra TaxID=36100 RepID=UPI001EE5D048|nr:serine/threonine-protein phosphatase 6 regulatory ankyrin repeat subunit B-like [Haliotis rubra]